MGSIRRSPSDPLVGRVLDRYRIGEPLGEGGMGKVYRAQQEPLGRAVALKVIHRSAAGDAERAARFLREAKIAASLRNRNTVVIHDFGQADDGTLFLAMELLEGESLFALLGRKKRLSPESAAEIALQVCRSLAEAHRKGIVHRDLKPENVFLCREEDGSVLIKVLDYGLARVDSPGGPAATEAPLTQVGQALGTPQYMSPEQVRAHPVDGRSDLYSLGVILFEMLTGVLPFPDRDGVVMTMAHHLKTEVPSMGSVGARVAPPPVLEELVRALLAKSPDARPAGVDEVIRRLRTFLGLPERSISELEGAEPGEPPIPADSGVQIRGSETTVAGQGHTPARVRIAIDPRSDEAEVTVAEEPTVAEVPAVASPPVSLAAAGVAPPGRSLMRIAIAALVLVAVAVGTIAWLLRSSAPAVVAPPPSIAPPAAAAPPAVPTPAAVPSPAAVRAVPEVSVTPADSATAGPAAPPARPRRLPARESVRTAAPADAPTPASPGSGAPPAPPPAPTPPAPTPPAPTPPARDPARPAGTGTGVDVDYP